MRKPVEQWHVSEFKLWHAPGKQWAVETNEGFQRVLELLHIVTRLNSAGVTIIDASEMSDRDRWDVYIGLAAGAAWWRYEVRRVYGTHSASGCNACREVPLLSIRYDEFEVPMLAPYNDIDYRPYRLVTALDALRQLSTQEQIRLFGQLA